MSTNLGQLIPLLTFLGGGAVALLGAWIGPAIQRRMAAEEAALTNRRTLLDKAEDVFVEIDRVQSEARKECYEANRALHSLPREQASYHVGDLGRLRGLLYLHFPSARTLIEDYDLAIARMSVGLINDSNESSVAQVHSLAFEGYRITKAFLGLLQHRVALEAEALHLINPGSGHPDALATASLDQLVQISRNEEAKI